MNRIGLLSVVFVLLLHGCRGPVEALPGDYEAEHDQARLLLRADGGGALSVGGEEAPFRWDLRSDGRVFLHTRQGGVIAAHWRADALELDMPGAGKTVFHKVSR